MALSFIALTVLAACERDGQTVAVGSSSEMSTTEPSATPATSTTDSPTEPTESTEPMQSVPGGAVPTPTSEPAAADGASPVGPAGTHDVVTVVGRITDPARNGRVISYKVYAPAGVSVATPVIVVSHGGEGNPRGHLAGEHLGSTFASGGFLAIHLAHDRPAEGSRAIDDRPADVTLFLDELAAGRITLPDGFGGTADLDHVGHTGHSFGAYTSHAVAGATYTRTYRDDRIDAIAPISPQGPDQFGAFLDGPGDSTWSTVTIPSYNLVGEAEISSNAVDSIERPGWRLVPFDNYPGTSDTFRTIIAGADHSDMWRTGAPDVQAFIATEILDFMRRYVAGDPTVDACGIGVGELVSTTATIERRPGATGTALSACPG